MRLIYNIAQAAIVTLFLCSVGFSGIAGQNAPCAKPLVGINLSGGEFGGKFPGTKKRDYRYPDDDEYAYAESNGLSIIRLPFRWERLQPALGGAFTLGGAFNRSDMADIDHAIEQSKIHSLKVILDMHNGAKYYGVYMSTDSKILSAYLAFWRQMARRYRSSDNVMFGLMNEPTGVDASGWARISQKTINAVRAEGFTGPLLVSGVDFSGAHYWFHKSGSQSNAEALAALKDPAHNLLIEMHQYFDADFTGTHECVDDFNVKSVFDGATAWLRKNKFKGFLGEYGGSKSQSCLSAIDHTLDYMESNKDAWFGSTYWSSGGNWSASYPYIIDFRTKSGEAQLKTITSHACR